MPTRRRRRASASGFSLLEMMVAISILALSLGALYQATSGATRNVRADEKYAFGVELARSLLADVTVVPNGGYRRQGETEGGYRWAVAATPIALAAGPLYPGALQQVVVSVSWDDGRRPREFVLHSVVEGAPKP